ncbi:MAG TPA: HAD-IB family hydrolase [Acidimicrobiales bacterium]|nr:HAD-IB family hydrolase [Acidimicrobiales bacterium]
MANGAAFFDLDRTLLSGASGPVISEALRQMGVLGNRSIPGENLVYRVFDAVGETLPAMALTRSAARFAAGWSRDAVREAGEVVAERLTGRVQPFGHLLMDEHRAAGRPVVMATTSPFDLVEPLAKALGMDDVIATRYGVHEGAYDGTIAGEFVWGPGKLAAVRAWAERHGIDLAASYAYSDSIFDAPLLGAVGNPMAINPDPRLRVMALVRRWPQRYLDVPSGVPKVAGWEPQRFLQGILRPEFLRFVRWDLDGLESLPRTGGAIIVANHRSYFDPIALGYLAGRVDRAVRFLAKKEVLDAPVVGQFARAMGTIRVDRGTGSNAPLELAAEALEAGELVVILPQGTIPRGAEFFEPDLHGRPGAARLAAMTKLPVVPVGIWGTEKVWPRAARVPDLTNITDPPTVRVRVGDPVDLKYRSERADTERIMRAIEGLLPAASRKRETPTAAEIAEATPSGRS